MSDIERIVIPVQESGTNEDPTYVQEMAAKGASSVGEEVPEQQDQQQQQQQESQQLLAGKYKTEEELHKGLLELIKKEYGSIENGYKMLEKNLGKQKSTTADNIPPQVKIEQPTDDNIQSAVEKAGLDFNTLNQEILESGKLSDSSYQAFEKIGIPKTVVDAYIEGQKLIAEKKWNAVNEVVGGRENLQQIFEWARNNLSTEEINLYNMTAQSGSIEALTLATEGLKAKYEKANGKSPNLIFGDSVTGDVGDVFRSVQEITQAMSDPRYGKDPAYTKDIEKKIIRSKVF